MIAHLTKIHAHIPPTTTCPQTFKTSWGLERLKIHQGLEYANKPACDNRNSNIYTRNDFIQNSMTHVAFLVVDYLEK